MIPSRDRKGAPIRRFPKLKIASRSSFDGKFFIVRGDYRTYRIHLGSSNILMEPNDQYLCIVPGRGVGPGDKGVSTVRRRPALGGDLEQGHDAGRRY